MFVYFLVDPSFPGHGRREWKSNFFSDKSALEKTEEGWREISHPFFCNRVKVFDTKALATVFAEDGGFPVTSVDVEFHQVHNLLR